MRTFVLHVLQLGLHADKKRTACNLEQREYTWRLVHRRVAKPVLRDSALTLQPCTAQENGRKPQLEGPPDRFFKHGNRPENLFERKGKDP